MSALHIAIAPDPALWDRYVLGHAEGGAYLTFAWKEAVEKSYGHRTFYLAAVDDRDIKGVLPLALVRAPFTRGRLVSLPFCDYGGCLADHDEAARLLIEYSIKLAEQMQTGLEIRSCALCTLLAGDSRFRQVTDKCRMVLELPASSALLWSGFKSKLRSQVNRSKKDGLVCCMGRAELLSDFYQVFSRNMRDLGSPVHAKGWLREVLAAFGSHARIGVVYKERQPLAAGVVLAHGRTLTIPWASSLRAFNRLSPNMLLYWSFLEYGADNDFNRLDFGRSTPGEGTYAFKQQWGAQPVPLYWYRRMDGMRTDRREHKTKGETGRLRCLAEKVWQRVPLAAVNFLGPHVRKYIDK